MTNEDIKKAVKKLGKLLNTNNRNGKVIFDPSSYDDINDMPVISIQGTSVMVDSVRIDRKGEEIWIVPVEGPYESIVFSIDELNTENENYNKEEIQELLANTYFETEESWEIGDFDDFLRADLKDFI